MMTNGGNDPQKPAEKKASALSTILLTVLIVAGIGTAAYFVYAFYAKRQQTRMAKIEEDQRKARVATEVASLIKEARKTADEDKNAKGALEIATKALKKDPESVEARKFHDEMTQAIELENLIRVKKLAEVRWAEARNLSDGQGFEVPLKKTEEMFAESEKLNGAKDYKNAATSYQAVAAECERLLALDLERRTARGSRDESDKARDAAEAAKADVEAKQMWADASERDKAATAAFENGSFGEAADVWKASCQMYADAAVFSSGTRAVRGAEETYNEILRTAKDGLLDKFGGLKWTSTLEIAAAGRRLAGEQKWAEAVTAWTSAGDSLRGAIKTALVEEARDIMQKKYNAAMTSVREILERSLKAPRSDSRQIKMLHGAISMLDRISASADYGLLTDKTHKELDAMLTTLHREKFYFRFPDLMKTEGNRDVSFGSLAPGSGEVIEVQRRAVADIDGFVEVQTRKSGITMRLIPAGSFVVGCGPNERGDKDERPRHTVTLSRPFYMATCEITQDQWKKIGVAKNPSHFAGVEGASVPVESVSFDAATKFCELLSDEEGVARGTYRLPTEAEWEYACRAGTDASFCAGGNRSDLDRVGWFDKNSDERTHSVGQKMPNAFGLYDMHGNVWEWCSDGARDYTAQAANDPTGSVDGFTRVTRGGSWRDASDICRSANRGWARKRHLESYDLGLRVIRVLPPEKPQE